MRPSHFSALCASRRMPPPSLRPHVVVVFCISCLLLRPFSFAPAQGILEQHQYFIPSSRGVPIVRTPVEFTTVYEGWVRLAYSCWSPSRPVLSHPVRSRLVSSRPLTSRPAPLCPIGAAVPHRTAPHRTAPHRTAPQAHRLTAGRRGRDRNRAWAERGRRARGSRVRGGMP